MEHIVDATADVTQVTPIVQGLFEDFNGIPFPQFFGQKQSFKTISFWNRVAFGWKLFASLVWSLTGFNFISVFLESSSGLYKDLGFLNKLLWIQYRLGISYFGTLNYDTLVFSRNAEFLLFKELGATASALWFVIFFPQNLFWRITANNLFDADWEDIDARGLDYSLTQATSYHYWKGKEAHGLFTMLWVNYVTDTLQVVTGIIPLVIGGIIYGLYELIMILAFPLILTIKVITPWKENQGETPLMWWVDAIDLGLTDPMNPPTNMFEIEDARVQYLSRFDDVKKDDE